MHLLAQKIRAQGLVGVLLALGVVILAVEPVLWLVRTWTAPAYDSPGGWVFAVVAALFVWSATSERTGPKTSARHAYYLFAATALVRLAGRVLAINVLGALALAVDVFALGLLFGLHRRKRAVSPFWLSVLFVFSLPIERIIQRLVGYGLQHVSAIGACNLLATRYDLVRCAGVHIELAGQPVLVDLPCSGARGLVMLSVLFAGLAAVVRPGLKKACVGIGLAMLSALVANSLRIATLAVGIALPQTFGGIDVMAQPWHDLIGLCALAFGTVPLVWWAGCAVFVSSPPAGKGRTKEGRPLPPSASEVEEDSGGGVSLSVALVFTVAAIAIVFAPQKPVDVAKPVASITLPSTLAGHSAHRQPLSQLEQDYFTRFGGAAAKASYGSHTLLTVQTSAPLRHLHAPDECLSGAGFEVESRGVTGSVLPGATYLATSPEGRRWRVVVTYVSDTGQTATSIAEVVWRWMKSPGSTWTAIQRFHPADASPRAVDRFDAAVARAFDLPDARARPF